MSNLHLVTGYAGREHITSADQGSFNASLMGNGEFVLERGKQFETSIIANNQVRVFDGDILMQGRHIRMEQNTYADIYFENGTQGYKRIDLIVARYTKDTASGVEEAAIAVIKGVPSTGTAQAPAHTAGKILEENASLNEMPLYEVSFDGINIQGIKKLFNTVNTWETDRKQAVEEYNNKLQELESLETDFTERYNQKLQELDTAFSHIISSDPAEWETLQEGKKAADAKIVGEKFKAFETLENSMEIVIGNLAAGNTETYIQSPSFTQDSIFSFYSSVYGVSPSNVVLERDGLLHLYFDEALQEDLRLGVRVDGKLI